MISLRIYEVIGNIMY